MYSTLRARLVREIDWAIKRLELPPVMHEGLALALILKDDLQCTVESMRYDETPTSQVEELKAVIVALDALLN